MKRLSITRLFPQRRSPSAGFRDLRRSHRQKGLFHRPEIETFEERIMLDAGLPSVLALGKTLTSITAAGIQNQRETITYTVYNLQSEPISGVLLTDTLEAGVTFRSASQRPDQNGQDLAWSLGTIPGFGRTSVDLTVTLAGNPVPLQLDDVTRAFATLDARMVSAEAPPAALRADAIPGNLLASTPDASSSDPFIQQKAAELGHDPQRIFDYLQSQVGYESYRGSMRGARGTLWSSAGNSLDVASLGVALMRASGIPAQYVAGTLSTNQAQQLILSMFPTAARTVGSIPPGTELADPAHDPRLLDETREHYWFQLDTGSGMRDADPLIAGAQIGQTFTPATGTFTEVPDNLREKTEVKLTAEVYFQSDAAFGLDPFHRTVVLDQTFNDVDLVGHPLTIGNIVNSGAVASPVFGMVTNTYSPFIAMGDAAFPDASHDALIRGQDYQEQMSNFPLASQYLTGLFLDTTLSGPGGSAQAYQATLFDRLGFDFRQNGGSLHLAISPTAPPAVSPFQVWSMSVLPGAQDPAPAVALEANLLDAYIRAGEAAAANDPSAVSLLQNVFVGQTRVYLEALLATSDLHTQTLSGEAQVRAYFDRPRITLVSSNLVAQGSQSALLSFEADLLNDAIRSIVFPGQARSVSVAYQGARGFMENVVETNAFPQPSASTGLTVLGPISTTAVFQAAAAQGIPLVGLAPEDLTLLDRLAIDPVAKARITSALRTGKAVLVPTEDVTIGGAQTVAWFEVDHLTGETIGVGKDGAHLGLAEYGYILISIAAVAAGTLGFFSDSGAPVLDGKKEGQLKYATLVPDIAGFIGAQGEQRKALAQAFKAKVKKEIDDTDANTGLSEEYKTKYKAEVNKALAFLSAAEKQDPPLPESLLAVPQTPVQANSDSEDLPVAANRPAGSVDGVAQTVAVSAAGDLQASWATGSTGAFLASSFSTGTATVQDAGGATVGSGTVALPAAGPGQVQLAVAGNDSYRINGTGSLSFYGPAETALGVSGNWSHYTAYVTGNVSITLTTDSLALNGHLLPAGTYTLTTTAATFSGSGATSSPNFSGSVSIDATNSTVNVGPGTGNLSAGGIPLDPTNGITLTGYIGSIGVAAGGGNHLDAVMLNGNAADVLTVSATPAAVTTDQNTPVTFQAHENTSFADTYTISAQAPPGWALTIDATGIITVTPAPGLQGGSYPIQIIAQSTMNPGLVAQTTVNVTITPTAPGITLAVQPDPLFTVPFNDAQVPTAFQVAIRNNGPNADTFHLDFADVPSGFALLNSGTSVTIPAGETGIVGVYLQPTAALPAAGTPLSFRVTATSTSNPALTQSATASFAMPVVDSVILTADPPLVVTTSGGSTTSTLFLKNVGNVAETVTLTAGGPADVAVGGLPQVTLAPGESARVPITVSASTAATLNSIRFTTITATFGATAQTATATIDVQVRSARTLPISQAAVAAGQANNPQLATTLSDLGSVAAQLEISPTSAAVLARARALLGNLSALLSADPALAALVVQLQPLEERAENNDGTGLLDQAAAFFGSLGSVLAIEATQQFTVSVSPGTIDIEPGESRDLSAQITNVGPDPVTLDLSAPGRPAGVGISFGQSQVTVAAGATVSVPLTLSNTLTSAKVFTLQVSAAASLVRRTGTAVVGVRPALADVLGVAIGNQGTVHAGDPIAATAQVFNVGNVARILLAHLEILDAAGHVMSTPPPVPFSLVPGSGAVGVDLGPISTTGLADGVYTLKVSLRAVDDSPVPGLSGQMSFAVGQLVTATIAASTPVVAPGTSTVATTISVNTQLSGSIGKTVNVVVPGNADPFLAGMPSGATDNGNDFAPAQSPIIVQGLPLAANDELTFSVSGAVNFNGDLPNDPPDGAFGFITVFVPENGIASTIAPIDALLGVFLGPNQPNLMPAPGALDFSPSGNVPGGLNYLTLAPQLQQPFFIGDGLTDSGQIQHVQVPAGATRLFLATADGFGWYNNSGSFNVQVTNLNAAATSLLVTHDLPAAGYAVNPASISPAATSTSASQVVWNTPVLGTTTQFQLGGSVSGMTPGEVRQISLGTTVTATVQVSASSAGVSVSPDSGPGSSPNDPFDISTGVTVISSTPAYPGSDVRDILGGSFSTLEGPGHTLFADRKSRQVDTLTFRTPSPVTIAGFHLFLAGDPNGVRSLTNFALMADGVMVSNTFIMSPGSRYSDVYGSSGIVVTVTFAPVTASVFTALFTANSGPFNGPRVYELDAIPASTGGSTLSQNISLQPLTVAATHIVSLTQAAQSADRGGLSSYTLELTNPYATDQAYSLVSDGLAGLGNNLPASVVVPAGQTVNVPLVISVPPGATPGDVAFQIFATTADGATDAVEGRLTVLPEVALNRLAVDAALVPLQTLAGQGTPATFTLRITNIGDTVDTYTLSAGSLPAGVTASFSQPTVTVAPGQSNFRDVTLTLTPAPGTVPGAYTFQATATSSTNPSIAATANGAFSVLASGVHVSLSPASAAPGGNLEMTVTNTGEVEDTFILSLTGPAALVATLGATTVSLAPGASQVVAITTGPVSFADPGMLSLTAIATSQADPAVRAAAAANLSIPETRGLTAEFTPGAISLQQVGPATFILLVHNTGNIEGAFTATITGSSGPLTAHLVGSDGAPTQTIPVFRLPGLFAGAILLHADLTAPGPGTVTIHVQSLDDGGISASATATVSATVSPTITASGGTFLYDGHAHAASGSVVGFHGANLGSPTLTYTDANNITTSNPPVSAGTYTVTASFAATSGYAAASSTAIIVISPATPTVSATASGGIYNTGPFPGSATVTGVSGDGVLASSPNASLTFTYYTGSSTSGSGSAAAPVDAGTYTVVAHYAGSANYLSADSNPVTFTIPRATPTVIVSGGTFGYNGQAHLATGAVTGIGGVNLGTPTFTYADANGVASSNPPVNAGTYTVTASFAGDANYGPASSAATIVITSSSRNYGILLLAQSSRGALTVGGNGHASVTGGGAILIDSTNAQAAIVSGNGNVSATEIDATGTLVTANGTLQGTINQSAPPTPDPLQSLPPLTAAMVVTRSTSTMNVTGNQQVTLQPGRYVGGIRISGQAHVILAPGVYYMDGGGFSVSSQATVASTGGVLLYNAPRSSGDRISFSGQGNVSLTGWLGDLGGLAAGVHLDNAYLGIAIFQERTSTASVKFSGQGNVTITGSLYAAGATIESSGNGTFSLRGDPTRKIGAHLIASDLQVSGDGGVTVDASNNDLALW